MNSRSLAETVGYSRRARAFGWTDWRYLVVAFTELARARVQIAHAAKRLPAMLEGPQQSANEKAYSQEIALIGRAIDRAAILAPWRADCLVKALAARNWLDRRGVPSRIVLGAKRGPEFAAHAWLTVGDKVVVGGDTSSYRRFASGR